MQRHIPSSVSQEFLVLIHLVFHILYVIFRFPIYLHPSFTACTYKVIPEIFRSTIYNPLRSKLADVLKFCCSDFWHSSFLQLRAEITQKSMFNLFSYHNYWSAVFLWVQVLVYNRKGYTWIADIAQNLDKQLSQFSPPSNTYYSTYLWICQSVGFFCTHWWHGTKGNFDILAWAMVKSHCSTYPRATKSYHFQWESLHCCV